MRAVKAFGVFIRLPKPRALLPIRLVDMASHVNEMQSRETLISLCQFVGPFLSSSTDGFGLLSVCLPRNVTPFFLSITDSDSSSPSLSLWKIMICLFPARAELCTSLMFSSKDLIHRRFFFFSISWETPVVIKHMLFCMRVTLCPLTHDEQ